MPGIEAQRYVRNGRGDQAALRGERAVRQGGDLRVADQGFEGLDDELLDLPATALEGARHGCCVQGRGRSLKHGADGHDLFALVIGKGGQALVDGDDLGAEL